MHGGKQLDPKLLKVQKLGPNFGRRYVWATDRAKIYFLKIYFSYFSYRNLFSMFSTLEPLIRNT